MIWYLILIQLSVNENTAASEVVSPELAIVLLILQMVGMRGALLPVIDIYQLPTRIEMVRQYVLQSRSLRTIHYLVQNR